MWANSNLVKLNELKIVSREMARWLIPNPQQTAKDTHQAGSE